MRRKSDKSGSNLSCDNGSCICVCVHACMCAHVCMVGNLKCYLYIQYFKFPMLIVINQKAWMVLIVCHML